MKNFVGIIQNERGQTTVDFIFASVLVMTAAAILMSICIGLSIVEIMQYASFSGARAYFAADVTPEKQAENADRKIKSFIASIPIIGEADNSWVTIESTTGAARDYRGEYAPASDKHPNHHGVELSFNLDIMKFRIPILGSTISYDDEEVPKATVSSLLGREPSFSECKRVMDQSYEVIKRKYNIPGNFTSKAASMLGNGC